MKVDYNKIAVVEKMIKECETFREKGYSFYMCPTLHCNSKYRRLSSIGVNWKDNPESDGTPWLGWYRGNDYDSRLAHLHFALFRLLGIVK